MRQESDPVARQRQIQCPELDTNRIALFGISMGGIRGVLLTAVDSRIKAATIGLAAGDLPYVLTHSKDRGTIRRREAFMRQHNLTPAEMESELRQAITCDPKTFAAHIDPRKVLLVLARFDRVVPFEKGWELRTDLGKPDTIVLPTGHYTALLAIPYIERRSLHFFEKRLPAESPGQNRKVLRSPRDATSRGDASY